MKNLLKKAITPVLSALLFFTLLYTQPVGAASVTAEDLIGTWEAGLKINNLELFGIMNSQRDELYRQEDVSHALYFYMKDGALMLNFGSTSMPVTLSGGKLSGTYSGEYMMGYTIESSLDGTVSRSAKGLEIIIHTEQQTWSSDRKNGSVISCTYTIAGADLQAETPAETVAEVPEAIAEPVVPEDEAVPVESIALEPKLIFLKTGETKPIHVKITPSAADPGDVVVESYDDKIVHVFGVGSVKGLKAGYSEITAQTRDGKFQAKSRAFVGGDNQEVVGVVLDTLWSKTKDFLIGESFGVNTPTGGGARG